MAEIRGAQTNTDEQANAPDKNTAQQAAQADIAEGSAAQGKAHAKSADHAEKAGQQAQTQQAPVKPAATSTQAEGGVKTVDEAPRADREKTPAEKADAAKVERDAAAAKAAGVEMVKVTVDGTDVEVPKGTLAIEACFRAGADVPYFCYHPRLTSVGACRMCLVQIELEQFGSRSTRMLTCCTVPVADGMAIRTQTPDVKKAQNGMLEFLLANHPLDCPICDRGGECPLQNMTIAYGPPVSRYIEEKRHFPKAYPISDYVVLDRERCIQCMRCTRFCEEISGDGQLAILNRGSGAEIGTFFGHDFSSNFSGNTIEICPVGALTSRTFRFAGRPWEINSTDSICAECGNGCNIAVQTRLNDVVRINARTNEDVNEEWTCDRGKFGQYYVNSEERIRQPLIRRDGELTPATWDEALTLVAEKMRAAKAESGPDSLAAIGSTRCTIEENYLLGRIFRGLIGTNNIDHRMHSYPLQPMQTSIAEIEHFKKIVSVGMELDKQQPIVYLRVYKAVRKNDAEWIKAATVGEPSAVAALREAGEHGLLLLPHDLSPEAYEAARILCRESGAKMNVLLPDCNSWGAIKAGALPEFLPGGNTLAESGDHVAKQWGGPVPSTPGLPTQGIFDAAARGDVRVLYIMGADPVADFGDAATARAACEKAFTVVQELFLTETARLADVVLPAASFAERDGTFANIEGREQKIKQALQPRGDSRPDWRILGDLMGRLGQPVAYFGARDIYREYLRSIPQAVKALRGV